MSKDLTRAVHSKCSEEFPCVVMGVTAWYNWNGCKLLFQQMPLVMKGNAESHGDNDDVDDDNYSIDHERDHDD